MEKILIIGANDFDKKKEALGYIASELDFPSYFGGNLDALFDCLCDIEDKVNIAIDPIEVDESPDWYEALYDTIVDAALENENINLFFPAITDIEDF
jgi:RNAse (barnase) inhibitor barstar